MFRDAAAFPPRRCVMRRLILMLAVMLWGMGLVTILAAATKDPAPPAAVSPQSTQDNGPDRDMGISGTGIAIDGTRFVLKNKDGRVLEQSELIGATFNFHDATGAPLRVRLDGYIPDPKDPTGEILLYDFSYQDGAGQSHTICPPGPDGLTKAFPMSGKWTDNGTHIADPTTFNLICTAGAIGKCVRFGFKPWGKPPLGAKAAGKDGADKEVSMWDLHQACIRAVRADYCGDGIGNTETGTLIDLFDRYGIFPEDPAGDAEKKLVFEAAFSPEGAICVARTRIPERATLDSLAKACPRLAQKLGPTCTEAEVKKNPRALIFLKSIDRTVVK